MSILLSRPGSTRLNPETPSDVAALRWRIEAYTLDEPAVADPLSARLAREQRWSAELTQRVITEYKRFVLLAITPSRGVTPSDAVDQVWHTHLTYTHEYWDNFCARVLGRPLHHSPGTGDAADHGTNVRNYGHTLERYRQVFSEAPPSDIWPSPAIRFGSQQAAARVNTRENLIVSWRSLRRGAAVGLGCGLGLPVLLGALVQAHGPVVAVVGYAAQACALFRAETLRARALPESAVSGLALHAYEAIFLAGGVDAVADAVIANLVARKSLALCEGGVTQRGLFDNPHPLEEAAYSRVGRNLGPTALDLLQRGISASTRDVSRRLRGMGLTEAPGLSRPFLLFMALPLLLIATAVAVQQAVALASFGGVLVWLFANRRYRNDTGVTALGKAALASFRRSHEPLNDECRRNQVVHGGNLPKVIALSGLEALRRFELGDVADALSIARVPAADSCDSNAGCSGGE